MHFNIFFVVDCSLDVLSHIIISDIGYYGSGVFNIRGNGQGKVGSLLYSDTLW